MGYPYVDLWGFRAMWLHCVLGLNVAFPIAPLHGPRRIGRLSGAAFMTYNLVDIVHGFAQAVEGFGAGLNLARMVSFGPRGRGLSSLRQYRKGWT